MQYKVKVRLILGFASGDLSVELPFTLTHPKPVESPPPSRPESEVPPVQQQQNKQPTEAAVDTNLIQLDTKYVITITPFRLSDILFPTIAYYFYFSGGEGYYANQDDDFIFEDFARLRLKGHDGDEAEA